ncbi:glycosyl hydrolase family 8 [Pseudoduganella lutea]|nr:glycosyl hydrolase family 8 [Pseudoduganella lutea]
MKQQKRFLLRALALAAVMTSAAPLAGAAVNEPYTVRVAYDPATPRATVTWGADAPAASGYGIERRPVGATAWNEIAYVKEPLRSHADTTVAPLTRYEYRVKAYRPGGPGTGYISTSTAALQLNFPYRRGYGRGILPSNYSQDQMDADVRDMYNLWRAKYVTTAGAGTGGARVYKPDEGGETVSEGQGYGMLISVYMADGANQGKSDFDKMLTYYKSKRRILNGENTGLMSWRINGDGSVADVWTAPDGDIDAAFALLVADKKWGSGNGNPNYWAEAQTILNGLQRFAVYNRGDTHSDLVANSEKELSSTEGDANFTMSSYQVVSYMRQFANASDATRAAKWRDTLRAGYKAFDYYYEANPATALTPYTFLTKPGANQYKPSAKGYNFGPDSCRIPWRVGLDFLWHENGNSRYANSLDANIRATLAQDLPKVNAAWFMNTVNNDPTAALYGYQLNGSPWPNTFVYGQRHTAGAMAVGAMTDASNQARLNTLYDWMRKQIPGQPYSYNGKSVTPEYYGDTVLMVTMIAVTGNMPNLPEVPIPAK